ncbi:MAG: phosphoribosylformylglycinamidine synthase subunit PurQ [Deltaproteobacteria bacterium]|nr:phosphoribosylformylglycinamidine synthase subunit PurQ [Deltaproteobacteria bacterium]
MASVNTIVITGNGTNCERECAHVARLAGSDHTDVVFFSDLIADRVRLADYNFLIFPGGFLDGDDLGAAQAAAMRWKHSVTESGRPLVQDLVDFHAGGGLILGICNGFQLLAKLGLLPALGGRYLERQVSLTHNTSARYEDRWVHLACDPGSNCVFTRGIDRLYIPVRHGEGRIVTRDEATLRALEGERLVAMRYIHPDTDLPTEEYPWNPNGSPLAIAALTDPSGRILGMMPHPEAYNHPTNHPAWTRGESAVLGTELFARGIEYLRQG